MVRDPEEAVREARNAWALVRRVAAEIAVPGAASLPAAFRLKNLALTHALYLEAIKEYLARGGKSRGSYLVPSPDGEKPCPTLEDRWRFELARPEDFPSARILEIGLDERGPLPRSLVTRQWVQLETGHDRAILARPRTPWNRRRHTTRRPPISVMFAP